MIESDPETPQSLRGRIDILMTLSGDNTAKG